MKDGEISFSQRVAHGAAWGGAGFALSAAAALGYLNNAHETTTIATHEATVSPTFDGHATLETSGAPKVRLPVQQPLNMGVYIKLPSGTKLTEADAYVAASPQGEIDNLQSVVKDMMIESASKGIVLGVLATSGAFLALKRREQFGENGIANRQLVGVLALGLCAGIGYTQLREDGNLQPDNQTQWVRVSNEVPVLKYIDDSDLQQLEVEPGLITDASIESINSVVSGYESAKDFYKDLEERVPTITPYLRQPEPGEVVAIQITDRHDNILVDPVARAIGDAAGATMVIDTGDDTSSGASFEAFSLNSVNAAFEGYTRILATGNHDHGHFVSDYLEKRGWIVLGGKPINIDGIRFLGDADPRASSVTDRMSEGEESVATMSQRLSDIACQDGKVAIIAVHSVAAAQEAAEKGCTDLVIGGHLHESRGPYNYGPEGNEYSTTYTTGTTGGAAFAFALGGRPKKEIQVTLITFRDDKPVGLQPVKISTEGEYNVIPYYELPNGSRDVSVEAEPDTHHKTDASSERKAQ